MKWTLESRLAGGFTPICASCKKIRDDRGYWNYLEACIQSRTEAQFSHDFLSRLCGGALSRLPDHGGMTHLGYQFENLVFKVAVATSRRRIAPSTLGHLERNAAFAGTANNPFLRIVGKTACEEPRNLW